MDTSLISKFSVGDNVVYLKDQQEYVISAERGADIYSLVSEDGENFVDEADGDFLIFR